MANDNGNWCLIESDPGVFTELIKEFGVKGVQVEEMYSLDPASFAELKPIYGLIFLFKFRAGEEPSGNIVLDSRLDDVFFAQQVIQNACASQALINLLMNCESPDVKLGSILTEFKEFTSDFDPATKGLCLSNSEQIRKVHNSFSRQHMFEMETPTREKEDAFHFIAYLPFKGRVYELDGLQEGPIDVGSVPDTGDWLDVVKPVIEKRIQRYSASEIRFNLMAVVSDKKLKYQNRLTELASAGVDSPVVAEEIYRLQAMIMEEDQKAARYRAENIRRRHNYIPFIVELLRILAEEKKLTPLVKQAKERVAVKRELGEGKTDKV